MPEHLSKVDVKVTTAKNNSGSDDEFCELVECLKDAVKKFEKTTAAIYVPDVLQAAFAVQAGAPDEYRKIVGRIRNRSSQSEVARWEKAIRQAQKQQKATQPAPAKSSLMELFSAIVEGGHDDERRRLVGLPTCSAHDHGTKQMMETYKGDPSYSEIAAADYQGIAGAITSPSAVGCLLLMMNRDFALVTHGASVRVVKLDPNGKHVFLRTEEVAKIFDNVRIGLSRSVLNMSLSAQTLNLFDVWCQWPKRRTYDSVGFYPGSDKNPPQPPSGCLNLWSGFSVEPKKGKWKALHKHLKEIICDDDPEKLTWLLDWMADLIQCPQSKPGTALVLRSTEEGTGKSLLINALLAKIFGRHALMTTKSDHIVGRFNGHMGSLVLLGAEEAVWAGSKAGEGTLKELITAGRLTYEQKGLEAFEGDNYLRVIMFSNEAWSVPAGPFSRRYFVLDVNPKRRGDTAYFTALHDELEDGGVEAFLFDMLRREITSKLRVAPVTEGLRVQREMSLDAVSRWIVKLARDGYVEDPDGRSRHTLGEDGETRIKADSLRVCFPRHQGRYDDRSFDTRLGHLLGKLGVSLERTMRDRKRSSWYVFPALPDFQAAAQKHFNVPIADGFGDMDTAVEWLREHIARDAAVSTRRLRKMAVRDGIDWIAIKGAIRTAGMEYEPADDGKTYVQWSDAALA